MTGNTRFFFVVPVDYLLQVGASRSRTSNPGSDERRDGGSGGSGGGLTGASAFALLGGDDEKKKKKKDSKVCMYHSVCTIVSILDCLRSFFIPSGHDL